MLDTHKSDIQIGYANPICTSDMNIRYANLICICDVRIPCAHPMCISDLHIRGAYPMSVTIAYSICISDPKTNKHKQQKQLQTNTSVQARLAQARPCASSARAGQALGRVGLGWLRFAF